MPKIFEARTAFYFFRVLTGRTIFIKGLDNVFSESGVPPNIREGRKGWNQKLKFFSYLGRMLGKLVQLKRITKGVLGLSPQLLDIF